AAPAIDGAFARACAELHDDLRRDRPTLQLALALFVASPADRVLAADALMPSRPLRALALLDVAGGDSDPIVKRPIGVDERVADFVRGVNRCDDRLLAILSTVPDPLSCASIDA